MRSPKPSNYIKLVFILLVFHIQLLAQDFNGKILTLKCVYSGRYLDVKEYGTSNGSRIHLWEYSGAENQQWRFERVSPDVYVIKSVSGNRCLDADGPTIGANGTIIQLWDCNGGANQQWRLTPAGNGNFVIHNVYSGRCLDADGPTIGSNGTKIQLWECHNNTNQQWSINVYAVKRSESTTNSAVAVQPPAVESSSVSPESIAVVPPSANDWNVLKTTINGEIKSISYNTYSELFGGDMMTTKLRMLAVTSANEVYQFSGMQSDNLTFSPYKNLIGRSVLQMEQKPGTSYQSIVITDNSILMEKPKYSESGYVEKVSVESIINGRLIDALADGWYVRTNNILIKADNNNQLKDVCTDIRLRKIVSGIRSKGVIYGLTLRNYLVEINTTDFTWKRIASDVLDICYSKSDNLGGLYMISRSNGFVYKFNESTRTFDRFTLSGDATFASFISKEELFIKNGNGQVFYPKAIVSRFRVY